MLYFEKKNGKRLNWKSIVAFLMTLGNGKWVIKRYKRVRTSKQNNYLRGLWNIVEKETGMDSEIIHEKMKMKFLKVYNGGIPYCRSTTSLSTVEFNEFVEKVKIFFAEIDIYLPDAEEFENI